MLVLTFPETNKAILSIRLFPSFPPVFSFFPPLPREICIISPFVGRISKPPYASPFLSRAQSRRSLLWPQLHQIPPPFTVANAPRMMQDPRPEMSTGSVDPSSSDCQLKSCTDCRTTTTPLWRAGPSGPKSLCNACGIRFRKNRRMIPASKKEMIASRSRGPLAGDKFKMSFKVRMLGLGLWEQRSVIHKKRRSSSLVGEEEQAAFLLMALSSGFV